MHDVQDLELLEFEESVEDAVVELAEEGERVSARQVLLLRIVNSHLNVKIWLLVRSNWVWHLGQVLVIWSALELVLELSELTGLVQLLRSVRVQMTQAVEVLCTKRLSSSIGHVWSVERVVNDLNSFPVTLCFQELIHDFFSALVAVGHDPSMEADEPNLLQEYLDLAGRVLVRVKHVRHLLDADAFSGSIATFATSSLRVLDNSIDEFAEVLADWEIDENFLEKDNEIIASKAANRLEALELSEWVHGCLDDLWVHIGPDLRDVGINVLNLVAVHHLLKEAGEWL